MADITLSGIEKRFGNTEVLKGIDLTIRDGEFLTLVGPSGCGKSTLLRIIAGLETQTSGDVAIGGRAVNGVRPSERDLAMVFQSYALYPHLTVEDNMLTPLRLRQLSPLERLPGLGWMLPGRAAKVRSMRGQVQETAEVLKIEALLKRKPGQLSGGQRQRAALGRAMVRKPVAFMMDEPLSNLDAALRVHMRSELAELHRSLATTFVYVTHDQAEALTMSNRMAVMMDGAILQLDSPDVVYRDPAHRKVAEFVGSPKINMLPAEIDGTGAVSVMGQHLRRLANAPAQRAHVGIRPEHLDVGTAPPVGTESFQARIAHKENLGSDIFVHGTLENGERLIARVPPDTVHALHIGADVHIWRDRGEAMLFGTDGARMPLLEPARPLGHAAHAPLARAEA